MKSRSFTKKFMLKNYTKFWDAICLIFLFPSLKEMKSYLTYCSFTYFISNNVRILINHQNNLKEKRTYPCFPEGYTQFATRNYPLFTFTAALSVLETHGN